jgi:arylsulfatase A-like enzyme
METCIAVARELVPAVRSGRYSDFHIAARRFEIRLNGDVYCHLLRETEPEFTCFYDNGADVLCHYYWEYFQPELFVDVESESIQRYGSAINDYYELNDAVFGRIIDHLDPSTSIVVVSDHGHTADPEGAKRNFYPRGEPVLDALGMTGEYYSIALASQTFVESVKTDPDERRAALEKAVDLLNSVTLEGSGARVFEAKVHGVERVMVTASKDFVTLDGTVRTNTGTHRMKDWFTTNAMSGIHEPEGIYFFKGPAFRSGAEGPQVELIDVAPTILYLAGLPLSREIDGEVVWEAFTGEFRAANEVAWVDSYGHFDSLRRDLQLDEETVKKLKALGYIR